MYVVNSCLLCHALFAYHLCIFYANFTLRLIIYHVLQESNNLHTIPAFADFSAVASLRHFQNAAKLPMILKILKITHSSIT